MLVVFGTLDCLICLLVSGRPDGPRANTQKTLLLSAGCPFLLFRWCIASQASPRQPGEIGATSLFWLLLLDLNLLHPAAAGYITLCKLLLSQQHHFESVMSHLVATFAGRGPTDTSHK